MSIANLWKRKDAKLRTLDMNNVMVAGCQKSRIPKKNCRFCLLLKKQKIDNSFFVIKEPLPKVLKENISKMKVVPRKK